METKTLLENKKNFISLILLMMIITICFIIILIFSKSNNDFVLDEVKLKESNSSDLVAVMLEQDTGEYVYSENGLPAEGYIYNEIMSGCMDSEGKMVNNSLTYFKETNKFQISTKQSVKCYLYFDKIEENVNET